MEQALANFASGGLAFAIGLTLLAGLITSPGPVLAFFTQRTSLRLLTWALAFSAG